MECRWDTQRDLFGRGGEGETIISTQPAAYVAQDDGGNFSTCPHRGWWTDSTETDRRLLHGHRGRGHVCMKDERRGGGESC